MPPKVVAIFGLVVVAMLAAYGFQAALADAGEDYTVVNETFTPGAGTITELENSNLTGGYYDNATEVYDGNGTEMDAGTDYTWLESNGTIRTLAGGGLDGDSEATITYSYQQTSKEQRGIAKALTALGPLVEVGMILGGVMLLLGILRGL